MKIRIAWIDSIRGIGAISVALLHATGNSTINAIVVNFGVPLFVFVSGYLFNGASYARWTPFLVQRLKGRIFPYVAWVFFFYLLVSVQNSADMHDFFEALAGILYRDFFIGFITADIQWLGHAVHNRSLWYLPLLFLMENVFYFISRGSSGIKIGSLVVVVCYGTLLFSVYVTSVPAMADMLSTHLVTFGIGYAVNEVRKRGVVLPQSKLVLTAVWFFAGMVCIAGGLALGSGAPLSFGQVTFRYFVTLCGIIFFGLLAARISGWSWLRYIGANSMIVFILIEPLRLFSVDIFAAVNFAFFDYLFKEQRELFTLFQVVAILVLSVPCAYIINKYVPSLVGKKRKSMQ